MGALPITELAKVALELRKRGINKTDNSIALEAARNDFWNYRLAINPGLKISWYQKDVAKELMQFYRDYKDNKRPQLCIEAPPQHGKSMQIIEFISWMAGKDPNAKSIYTSFSKRLGIRANLRLQRIYDSEQYKAIFPETTINKNNTVTISGQFLRNREIIEYINKDGYFRNTTVAGSITGESLDIGIIDDAIKGREAAQSETVRNKIWDWLTDDFLTRFSDHGALLVIGTRWHIDDPIGRLRERFKNIRVLSYPAIAIKDEANRKEGEALFPEHKSIDFLLERKRLMSSYSWSSLYQSNPINPDGAIVKPDWIRLFTPKDLPGVISEWIQSWDLSFKDSNTSSYVVGQVWARSGPNKYLMDQVRRQMGFNDTLKAILTMRANYPQASEILIEDKANGPAIIDTLKKSISGVIAIQPDGSKESRFMSVAPQFESGNVFIPQQAEWKDEYISELVKFPVSEHNDQVDATSQALRRLGASEFNYEDLEGIADFY